MLLFDGSLIQEKYEFNNTWPSTGLISILYFIEYYKDINITGFNFFQKVIPMLNQDYIQSGSGLDTLWGLMLDHKNMGVIDYISVVHMRPVGSFQKKKTGNFKVLTIDPQAEEKKLYANSKIKFRKVYKKTINTISLNNKIAFLFLTRDCLSTTALDGKMALQVVSS